MSDDKRGPRHTPEVAYNVVGERIGDDREQLLNFHTADDLAEVSDPPVQVPILSQVDDLFRRLTEAG